jgi:hypothetical protein
MDMVQNIGHLRHVSSLGLSWIAMDIANAARPIGRSRTAQLIADLPSDCCQYVGKPYEVVAQKMKGDKLIA